VCLLQVITNEEAERRGKMYDANGMTYLFDLDYHDSEALFTVDAGVYGNISHFVNHSVGFLEYLCFSVYFFCLLVWFQNDAFGLSVQLFIRSKYALI